MSLEVVESTKMQEDGRWITFRLQIWNAEWFQVIFMQNLLIWTSDALWEFAWFPVMRVFGHLTSTFFLGFCCKGSSTTATFVRKLNLKLWREKSETSRKNQGQGGHQPLTPRTSEMVRPGDDLGSWGNVWEDRWMMYGSRHVCRQFIHIDGDQQHLSYRISLIFELKHHTLNQYRASSKMQASLTHTANAIAST